MNGKKKGKAGELELAKILRGYGYEAKRGVQYKGGSDSPDVVGLEGIHIECKRVENLNIYNAVEQADRDCGENMPVVMHRRNNKPWLATLHLEDFMKLYKGGNNLLRY